MKKGWIFLLIFVLCIGVLVYGYADTMTELKTHVNPAPQVGDEPGLAMAALEDALGKRSYPDDYAGMYIDGASLVVMLTDFSDETQAEYRELAGSPMSTIEDHTQSATPNVVFGIAAVCSCK